MKKIINEEGLELRMYFFTIYQLMGIQKGIQAGHSALRYARKFSKINTIVWDFVDNHETWVILDGGTTNCSLDINKRGSINIICDELKNNSIEYMKFIEPDLNDALTAVCFICDERVFNRKKYPDFVDYILDIKMYKDARNLMPIENEMRLKIQTKEWYQQNMPEYYQEWIEFLGGEKNVFLRELIKDKKLATN